MRSLVIAILFFATSAVAADSREAMSGADLVKLCEGKDIAPTCAAYIDGVRSGMRAYRLFIGWSLKEAKTEPPAAIAAAISSDPFCVPAGTTTAEVTKAVVQFVKDFAPAAKEPASLSIVTALREAYPCGGAAPR
jgi:hypothetical protein